MHGVPAMRAKRVPLWRVTSRDESTDVSYTHLRAHETVLDLVCRLHVSVRPSLCVCMSVTLRYCVKAAKRRIMQIMSHDRFGTLVYTVIDKHIALFL